MDGLSEYLPLQPSPLAAACKEPALSGMGQTQDESQEANWPGAADCRRQGDSWRYWAC